MRSISRCLILCIFGLLVLFGFSVWSRLDEDTQARIVALWDHGVEAVASWVTEQVKRGF